MMRLQALLAVVMDDAEVQKTSLGLNSQTFTPGHPEENRCQMPSHTCGPTHGCLLMIQLMTRPMTQLMTRVPDDQPTLIVVDQV